MTRLGNRAVRTARRLTLGAVTTAAFAALVVPHAVASPESDAADAINQAWQSAGGSGSPVGGRDGDVFTVGEGYGQKFSSGKIFFTPATGAHLIYGSILDKYEAAGGPADSDFGFPTIDEVPGLISGNSRVSTFSASDKPAIFWTPDTGAWAVRGAINVAWDKLGGSSGVLGVPVEDERYDGDKVSQKFTGGELTWNSTSNTFTSEPAALADNLVGLEVPMDPTTRINQAWRATGGLGGPLGARQGEQAQVGDGGAAQGYAGGKIFYSPATGAHALTGAILSKYESLGGPTGDLGFPVGSEAEGGVPNSRVSSFSAADRPVIFWTPDNGAVVVRGAINAAWDKLGGATGTLGAPTGEQQVKGDTVTQTFSGGEVSWNSATREFSTKPADLASGLSGLEMPDAVGQAPAETTPGGTTAKSSGWHWWWLAIIIPMLVLLGLLAVWAQRRGRSDARDDSFGAEADDRWLEEEDMLRHTDGDRVSPYSWGSPAAVGDRDAEFLDEDAGFGGDEDSIDTAPTRIPSHAGLAETDSSETAAGPGDWADEPDLGRHAAETPSVSSMWQVDLDVERPRRRHSAAETLSWWSDTDQDLGEHVEAGEPEHDVEPADEPFDEVTVSDVTATSVVTDSQQPLDDLFGTTQGRQEIDAPEVADVHEPWRPAIHLPLADPYQAPEGYVIKANTHSGLYYTPDSALYNNTLPEVWFATEDLAQANGFVKAPE